MDPLKSCSVFQSVKMDLIPEISANSFLFFLIYRKAICFLPCTDVVNIRLIHSILASKEREREVSVV